MDAREINLELDMTYEELVNYLLKKYGAAKYDYFTNETCTSKSKKISRTAEGLFCHHIDEDKCYNLSDKSSAKGQPFSYQKADRLVYCNYLEHLMLHMQIATKIFLSTHGELKKPKDFSNVVMPGIRYIVKEINSLYEGLENPVSWRLNCFRVITENRDDYIHILLRFIKRIDQRYTGKREKNTIKKGDMIDIPKLGEGTVMLVEPGNQGRVAIKIGVEQRFVPRHFIDPGDYEEELQKVKNILSLNSNNVIVDSIYNHLS